MSGSASSPLIPQGTINRIRGNVQVSSFPGLNITASFMGEGGFEITWGGPATTMINTLTGRVPSPEPYQPVDIAVHLVKSQSLAAAWESQRINLTTIGNILCYTDAMTLPTYAFQGCAIQAVGPITVNGKSAEYMLTLTGTYVINNQLWALTV